jgi:hypothetical protein
MLTTPFFRVPSGCEKHLVAASLSLLPNYPTICKQPQPIG